MPENATRTRPGRMADLLRIRPQHLRSVRIERDFGDPSACEHYVVTPFIRGAFDRLCEGLRRSSTARAWRLTGDYGSGKSSLALAFARHASALGHGLPEELRDGVREVRLQPILVVGEREPLARSIARALRSTLGPLPRGPSRGLVSVIDAAEAGDGAAALEALEFAGNRLRATSGVDGILLVLDELGRNLEHAAAPGGGGVHLLQDLAEAAARSGPRPLHVLAVLHQAVTAYASDLSTTERREWEKVSGRFEEIVFAPPLEQSAVLVAAALDVRREALPTGLEEEVAARMAQAIRGGWYGAGAPEAELVDLAPGLAPMDPMVLPVMSRILRRFGQNERSLFGFLSSGEPHGLLAHAQAPLCDFEPYRLHNLYDYVSANLSGEISSGPAATRWGVIDAVVRSAPVRDELDRSILKTVGIVNVLDDVGLSLRPDLLGLAVAGTDLRSRGNAATTLRRLREGARVLYDRGAGGGLCLWPHTSVDLEAALESGLAAASAREDLVGDLRALLPPQPLVARRHYVDTGALRHFEVAYRTGGELTSALAEPVDPREADGRVVVVLSRTDAEREMALGFLADYRGWTPTLLVGVPEPVGSLAPLIRDVHAWKWVSDNTPALSGDRIAREEVARQAAAAEDRLRRSLEALLDLRAGGALTTRWLHRGGPLDVRSGRQLSELLSDICDDAYDRSPRVVNELINRRSLSSAATRARSVLIEALAQRPDVPFLGLDRKHTPPEVAIYLSVLLAGGVHVEEGGRWRVAEPTPDPFRLMPALGRIAEVLTFQEDRRVPFAELAAALREPPYGVRDGLIPLLLAIYLAVNWHRTAVYEEGTYLEKVGDVEFYRMLKEPEHFSIQHCAVEGVRAEVFRRLASVVGVASGDAAVDLLDIVRPLLRFVAQLPDYARRTRNLSVTAAAVRAVLLRVQDPTALVFTDLPRACGLPPFPAGGALDQRALEDYGAVMSRAVRELADAYPALLERISAALGQAMEAGGTLEGLQAILSHRADRLLPSITEPELKAYALRLADRGLMAKAWIEALASFLARKPPERWAESDEREFHHQLRLMSRRYRRVQATADGAGLDPEPGRVAFRLVVTAADGRELEELVHGAADDAAVGELETRFTELLARNGRAGLLAAARALVAAASLGCEPEPSQEEE